MPHARIANNLFASTSILNASRHAVTHHPQTNASIVLILCRRGMTPTLRRTRHLWCHQGTHGTQTWTSPATQDHNALKGPWSSNCKGRLQKLAKISLNAALYAHVVRHSCSEATQTLPIMIRCVSALRMSAVCCPYLTFFTADFRSLPRILLRQGRVGQHNICQQKRASARMIR